MGLVDLSAGLSAVAGGVGAAVAGFRAGPWQGIVGFVVGVSLGAICVGAVAAATGVIAFAVGGRSLDTPAVPGPAEPPSRLAEFGFFLFLSPIAFAPVWVPVLTYKIAAFVFGGGA